MAFSVPIATPLDRSTYPTISTYDPSDTSDTWNWKLYAAVEGATVQIKAACAGYLSAVPPNELPPTDLGFVVVPNGTPETLVRLYLEPSDPFEQVPGTFVTNSLETANLGSRLRWFRYGN